MELWWKVKATCWILDFSKATPVAQGCKRHCKIVAVAVPASLTSMAAWMLRESADSGWMHTHAKRTNRLRKQYVDLQLRGRSPRHTAWMTVAQSPWSLDAQPTLQVHIPHGRDATDQHLHTLFHYGVVQRKHMIQNHLLHSHWRKKTRLYKHLLVPISSYSAVILNKKMWIKTMNFQCHSQLCPAHRHLGSHRILRASCQADKDHPHFWRNLSYLLWWYVSQTNPLISSQIISNCTPIMVGVSMWIHIHIDTEIYHSYIISMCIYSVYI